MAGDLGEHLDARNHAAAVRWPAVLLVLCAACGKDRDLPPYDSAADVTAGGPLSDGGGESSTTNDDGAAEGPFYAGACATQDDCGGQSQASVLFCKHVACGYRAGFCTMRTALCPVFAAPVCGCDGESYSSSCYSDVAAADVDYAGPCRSGAIVACDASQPCGINQVCVDDPRALCPAGGACPGVCLTRSVYGCGENTLVASSCLAGFCTGSQASSCADGHCSACVFGSASCGADTPCPTGQLCVPTIGCRDADAGACASFCVLP